MVRFLTGCLLIFMQPSPGAAQTTTQYKDALVAGDRVYALTATGQLRIFDQAGRPVANEAVPQASPIDFIALDQTNHLFVCDRTQRIRRYSDPSDQKAEPLAANKSVYQLLVNSQGRKYAVTEQGILDTKANRTFQPGRSPNGQIHSIGRWPRPTSCLLDRADRIWVGFDHGEWGGDLAIFDTRTGQFLTPDLGDFAISLFPIASIFQDSAAVYFSAGLAHLGMSTGRIVRFDQPLKATTLFISRSEWEKPDTTKRRSIQHLLPGEFIGPAAYNSANQSIYYFAQTGIHVGRLGQNLADAKNWPVVAKPELTWVNGRSNAVGPPMTVLKILPLTANTFLLLTQNNGLLYFHGTQFSPCP